MRKISGQSSGKSPQPNFLETRRAITSVTSIKWDQILQDRFTILHTILQCGDARRISGNEELSLDDRLWYLFY